MEEDPSLGPQSPSSAHSGIIPGTLLYLTRAPTSQQIAGKFVASEGERRMLLLGLQSPSSAEKILDFFIIQDDELVLTSFVFHR